MKDADSLRGGMKRCEFLADGYELVFQNGEKRILPNFMELHFKFRPGRSVYRGFQN